MPPLTSLTASFHKIVSQADPARPEPPIGLDYARRVYDRVTDWYKVAGTRKPSYY